MGAGEEEKYSRMCLCVCSTSDGSLQGLFEQLFFHPKNAMVYFRLGKANTHNHLCLFPGQHTMKLLPDKVSIFLQFITLGIMFWLVFLILFAMQLTDIHVIYS